MSDYRRWRQPGGCVFLTVVTFGRQDLFADTQARQLLRESMDAVQAERPWQTEGIVLLPNHWHALWRLPEDDANYSTRVAQIKKRFTDAWLARGGREGLVSPGKRRWRRRGVWQPRFWEHTIRGPTDFKMHLDYIHLNPVKHGLVRYPKDWPWSSFRRWANLGEYDIDWLGRVDLPGAVEYFWHDG